MGHLSPPSLFIGDFSHLAIPRATARPGFSAAAVVARVLASSAEGTSATAAEARGRVAEALASGAARNLSQAIDQLNPSERKALRARWGRSLDELISLSNERDARVFHHGLLQIGRRLEENDQVDLAGVVYSSLVVEGSNSPHPPLNLRGGEEVVPPLSLRGGQEGLLPSDVANQAQRRLNAIHGVGDWRERFAFSLQRIPGQATRWDVLLAMTGAGFTFRGFRLLTTASWAGSFESALALNAASTSTAFLAETIAFTSLGKVAGALAGHPQDTSANGIFNEWAGGAAMLLGLKGMGAITGAGVRSIYGEAGAVGARHAVPLRRFTEIFAPQAGMFMGILVGNRLAEAGGFHPERHGDNWLIDGVTTLIEFNVAGRIQRAAGGPGLLALEGQMEALTRGMSRGSWPPLSGRLSEFFKGEFVSPEGLRFPAVPERPEMGERPSLLFTVPYDETRGTETVTPISGERETKPKPSQPPAEAPAPILDPEMVRLMAESMAHDLKNEAAALEMNFTYVSDLVAGLEAAVLGKVRAGASAPGPSEPLLQLYRRAFPQRKLELHAPDLELRMYAEAFSELRETVTAMNQVNRQIVNGVNEFREILTDYRDGPPTLFESAVTHRQVRAWLRLAGLEQIDLSLQFDRSAPVIAGPPQVLRRILNNLVTNSREAMATTSRPWLAISTQAVAISPADFDQLEAIPGFKVEPGNYLRLRVEDAGAGMDAATVQRLFDQPYSTKRRSGFGKGGMGLFWIGKVLRDRGGFPAVRSTPGAGTRIDLYFPELIEDISESSQVWDPKALQRIGVVPLEKIFGTPMLIVDDEPCLTWPITRLFTQFGFQHVHTASTLEAARQTYRAKPGIGLLIVDEQLPDGSGLQFLEELTRENPGIAAIYWTGNYYNSENYQRGPLRHSFTKPASTEALREQAVRLLTNYWKNQK